jgi:hypothetical protein
MSNQDITPTQILSVAEGIEIQKRLKAAASARQWRWMGNYGDVYPLGPGIKPVRHQSQRYQFQAARGLQRLACAN